MSKMTKGQEIGILVDALVDAKMEVAQSDAVKKEIRKYTNQIENEFFMLEIDVCTRGLCPQHE